MWIATYACNYSRTGKGVTIVRTTDIPEFFRRHPDAEFRIYRPEECEVFTPEVVTACMGSSPSM